MIKVEKTDIAKCLEQPELLYIAGKKYKMHNQSGKGLLQISTCTDPMIQRFHF